MRRWLRVLPAVFVTYSLAYLDRSNFGFGVAGGMAQSLSLSSSRMALLAGVFFLGYFLFQIPGASMVRRTSVRSVVTILLLAWGIFAALTGVVRSFAALVVIRFLLGAAESLIFPAMLLLLTRWFTRAERSRANSLLILGNPVTVLWMSAVTGYLIEAVGWRSMFLIEGLPSVLWGVLWFFLMRDHPAQARWLDADERTRVGQAIAAEQVAIEPMGLRQALLRRNTLVLAILYFFWSLGVYGFVLWLPVIVHQGSQLAMGRAGLLTATPYAAAIVAMLVVSHLSDKTLRRQAFVWPSLLVATLGLFASYLTANRSFMLAFCFLVIGGAFMYAPYGPFFAGIAEHVPANATVEVLALINSLGALGGFAGSYLVGLLQAVTGSSRASFLLMSISLCLATALCFMLRSEKGREASTHAGA